MPHAPQVTFLEPLSKGKRNVKVGRFTYYDDDEAPETFFERNVRYHFEFIGDRLVIGPFCAIAKGATFIMNGANHQMTGFSTFPFAIFRNGWDEGFDINSYGEGVRGNTKLGADVWVGANATILPGIKIGDGAIIAANAVVSKNVKPYTIVAGNPARRIRQRFDDETIAALQAIAWWDWPVEKITRNLPAIRAADLAALQAAE
jgi:virginiamycin A acetyltransferase